MVKKKRTEKYDCKYAIKVIHSDGIFPIKMELYDRFDRCVFRVKDACQEGDGCNAGYERALNACYQYADEHGNNENWIYVHNPYEIRCKDIKI